MNGGTSIGAHKHAGLLRRYFVKVLACTIVVFPSRDSHSRPLPLDEGEIYAFLQDWVWAGQKCDSQWIVQHTLPTTRFIYTADGRPPIIVRSDEVAEVVHKRCSPTFLVPSYDQRSYSVQVKGYRAIIRDQLAEGSMSYFFTVLHFLQLAPNEIESIGSTVFLSKDYGGRIYVEEVRTLVTLVSKASQLPNDCLGHKS